MKRYSHSASKWTLSPDRFRLSLLSVIHPGLLAQMAKARTDDLRRSAERGRRPDPAGPGAVVTYPADPEGALRALADAGCTTLLALNGATVVARVQLQADGDRLLLLAPGRCSY